MSETIALSSCFVAPETGVVRDCPRSEALRNESFAERYDCRPPNSNFCKKVRRNPERPRRRYLMPGDEAKVVGKILRERLYGPQHESALFIYLLLLAVSIALCFVLAPFFSTVLWSAILALIFQPVQRWLVARLGGHRNLAAIITLTICLLIVILPLTLVSSTLVREISNAYGQVRSGSLDIALQAAPGTITRQQLVGDPAANTARVLFELDPGGERASELRLVLRRGGRAVSETWLYRWTP